MSIKYYYYTKYNDMQTILYYYVFHEVHFSRNNSATVEMFKIALALRTGIQHIEVYRIGTVACLCYNNFDICN